MVLPDGIEPSSPLYKNGVINQYTKGAYFLVAPTDDHKHLSITLSCGGESFYID